MKYRGMKILTMLLTLAMVVGLVPGMSLTAYAATKTITWNNSTIGTLARNNTYTDENGITVSGNSSYGTTSIGTNWRGTPLIEINDRYPLNVTFSLSNGNFTNIVINCSSVDVMGGGSASFANGFTQNGNSVSWSGNANTITLAASGFDDIILFPTSIVFTIEEPTVAVTSVTVSPTTATLTVGGTQTLTATVLPDNATDKTVTWTTSNASVATVADGVVTAVAPGTATITVTSNADSTKTATCIVTVNAASYTITWKNYDGSTLSTDTVTEGTTPVYNGATPTRPDDASYHYTFAGWSPELAVVTDNVTYTAVFSATPIQVQPTTYTVSFFANGGGGVMNPVTVPANTIYTLPACGFTPPAGKQFKAWQLGSTEFAPGDTIKVDSNAEFVALWKDDDGGGESGHGGGGGDIVFIGGFGGNDGWDDGGYYAPQRAWKVKLAPMVNGSAALGIMTGESTTTEFNVYPTTTIYVFPNANPGFVLDKIIWSYIDGTASYDITEAKNFVMPAMDVVVYVTFKPLGS